MIRYITYGIARGIGGAIDDVRRGGTGCMAVTLVGGAVILVARIARDATTGAPISGPTWIGLGLGAAVVLSYVLWCLRGADRREPLAPSIQHLDLIPFRAGVMAVLDCSKEFADAVAVRLKMDPEKEYPKAFFLWLRDHSDYSGRHRRSS